MKRSALITGGTGSIGSAIVARFVTAGIDTCFTYLRSEQEAERLRHLSARGIRVDLAAPDLSVLPSTVDILVNCAGVNEVSTTVEDLGDELWNATLSVNLTAPFVLCRHYLRAMRVAEWGRIVNVGSIYSRVGSSLNSAYNVSKHGLSGLTKSIAKEYARYGITANEVLPGPVESRLMDAVALRKSGEIGSTSEEYLLAVAGASPDLRLATPAAVADCVFFLCSEPSGHVNGTAIVVDGGRTC